MTYSRMNFNYPADRSLSARILAELGYEHGDTVVVEERGRTETRIYLGEITFCWVDHEGNVAVTVGGRSGWAPGSCAPTLVGEPNGFGARVLRKVTREEYAEHYRTRYSTTENSPINSRVEHAVAA